MHLLEKKVLELIGEDPENPDVFLDTDSGIAPIREALNDAIQEIAMLNGTNKRQYFIPLRAEQQLYRILLNYGYVGWITDVWLINKKYRLEQTGILKLTRYDPRWMVANADPRAYFPIGNDTICVYPKPSGSTDTLEITLVEIPIEYTDERAKIRLKKDFAYAAVEYAVSEYWASRGDAEEAAIHFEKYRDVMNLREHFEQSPQQYRTFRSNKEPYPTETS
jgi:hypothetical protein